MNDRSDQAETTPSRPKRRRWPYVVALLALPVLAVVGVYAYLTVSAESELQAAIAETDRLDPRWRLEDVEADRAVVPEAENAGTVVIAAKQLLPKDWPFWAAPPTPQDPPDAGLKRETLQESFRDLEPQRLLNDKQTSTLRTEMTRAAAALAEARKLPNLTAGRTPVSYSMDWIDTLMPHLQDAREIAALLSYDALLRAQDKDPNGALASCRGTLNAGRSIGDEPNLIAQLVRIACRAMATGKWERALAQGEPSEDALRQCQELLEKEESEPLLLIGIRGERAGLDRLMANIRSGDSKLSARNWLGAAGPGGQSALSVGEVLTLWVPGSDKVQRATLLRDMNRAVELAKLPPEQQHASFQKLQAMTRGQPALVRLLVPAINKISDAARRSQAQLRCAIVAVAAERYRLAKGKWPDTLDVLKEAGYVVGTTLDPYDGQPLRWRRLDDGAEAYSVGPDGEDNGGKMDRKNPMAPGTDLGFCLWDPSKRRQPPVEEAGPKGK